MSFVSTACPSDGSLHEFAEGLLSASQRDEVEAHLDRCALCRACVAGAVEHATSQDAADLAGTLPLPAQERPAVDKATVVGRYVVLREVGRGGMGRVFAAYDPKLDRTVALKSIRDARPDPDSLTRLLREAQVLARLSHPNVVSVHDAVESEHGLFVAMEFVDGRTLTQWQEQRKPGWREVLSAYRQAALGLAAAHAEGVVHRDFKPDNVMVQETGTRRGIHVRVLDFGLAHSMPGPGEQPDLGRTISGAALGLTLPGALVGTPAYMSPEQFRHEGASAASDQFSFCVALYEALEGQRPFEGSTLTELGASVAEGSPRTATGAYPSWLKRVVHRGLSADICCRYPSMTALLDAVESGRMRRRRASVVAGVFVIGTAAMGLAFYEDDAAQLQCRDAARELATDWEERWQAPVRRALEEGLGPDAVPLTANVVHQIDAFAADWRRAYDSVCTAAYSEGSLTDAGREAAVNCLEHQREFLAGVVGSAEADSPEALWGIVSTAATLPSPSGCEDPSPVPEGSADAQPRISAARRLLARARGRASAGAPASVVAEVEPALAVLEGVDAAATRAQLLALLAVAQYQLGDPTAGRVARSEALREASRGGDEALVARLWLVHVRSVLVSDRDPAQAAILLEAAAVAAAAVPDDPQVRSLFHSTRGAIALNAGRYEDAREDFTEALASMRRGHPTVQEQFARRSELAFAQAKLGRGEAALATQRDALAGLVEAFGERHPEALGGLENIAVTCRRLHDDECARDALERSLALRGPQDRRRARPLVYLGQIEFDAGEIDAAERLAREALALQIAQGGESAPASTAARMLLVNVFRRQERYEEALTQAQAVKRIKEEVTGPEHPGRALGWSALGAVLLDLDRNAEAEDAFRRSLAIREQAFRDGDARIGDTLTDLATTCLATGKRDEALQASERAVLMLDDAKASASARARARFVLAQALGGDEHEAAEAHAREALALYESEGAGVATRRDAVRAWLER